MNKILMITIAAGLLTAGAVSAQTTTNQNKKVTVIHGQASADGKSQITERPLEECIVSLPTIKDLEADVTAKSEYLKEINGDAAKNAHTQMYTATVTVSYKVRQKFILIITSNSIEAKDPVMEEKERTVMMSKSFTSDPGQGDMFAGRSNRRHFYSTPDAAAANAKSRAESWIKQQQNVLCSAGGGK